MERIKKHKIDEMKDIYLCNECHKPEYYGMFYWHNGHQYCRDCIYNIWTEESYNAAKINEEKEAYKEDRKPLFDRMSYWRPSRDDLIFPLYNDNINYYERTDEYE